MFDFDELIAPVILFATAKPLEHPNNTQIKDKAIGPFSKKLLLIKKIKTVVKEQTVPIKHIFSKPSKGLNLLFIILPKI